MSGVNTLWDAMRTGKKEDITEYDIQVVSDGDHTKDCPVFQMTPQGVCTCGYWDLSEMIWGEPKAPQTRQEVFKDEWPWLYKYHRGLRIYLPFLHDVRP